MLTWSERAALAVSTVLMAAGWVSMALASGWSGRAWSALTVAFTSLALTSSRWRLRAASWALAAASAVAACRGLTG